MKPAVSERRAEATRYGRRLARTLGIPCVPAATFKRRAMGAAVHRWGLPNVIGPANRIFGISAVMFVDDDADGAPRLVVTP